MKKNKLQGKRGNASDKPAAALLPMDVSKLIHDLQVYQIELEMQNEELRKTQLALEESRNRYVDLYDFAPLGYFILDKQGVIDVVNLAGAHLLGVEKRYLLKTGFFRFVSASYQELFHRHCQLVFNTKAQQTCELQLLKKNGTPFYVQLNSMVVQHGMEACPQLRVSIIDITQRRIAEERAKQHELELAHFSRLNVMGEMASGMAHELSQPLTAIVHYVGGCLARLRRMDISAEIITIIERVVTQAERAGAIIHRLKSFLKKEELQKVPLDINIIIDDVLLFLEYEIKRAKISIQLELGKSLSVITGDRIQLQQVILNIIHNAIDAMEARNSSPQLNIVTRQIAHDKMEIIIADNGSGILNDLQDKIFEPFFTTKAKGMGMGLAIVRSIIEAHDGYISIVSNPDIGTRFHLFLPISRQNEEGGND